MRNIMSSTPTEHNPVITVSLPLSEWQTISASIGIANASAKYDADADEVLGFNRAYSSRRTSDLLALVYKKLMSALIETSHRSGISLAVLPVESEQYVTDAEFLAIKDRYEEAIYNAIYSHSVNLDEAVPF